MQLHAYLTEARLTQGEAASRFGCTQGRISQLLKGATPSFALAQRIAEGTKGKVSLKDWPTSAPKTKAA